jgi:hypothetical protein
MESVEPSSTLDVSRGPLSHMKRLSVCALALASLTGLGIGACGACGDEHGVSGGPRGTGGSGGAHRPSTSAGDFQPIGGGSPGAGGGPSCGGIATQAQPIALDVYLMLDKSGSMAEAAAGGVTKWGAVTDALRSFFADPASAGIGVGLQFFPTRPAGVPATCSSNEDCGAGGPCILRGCSGASTVTPCTVAADCPLSQCLTLGHCANDPDPNSFCAPAGGTCAGGLGACQALTSSVCAAQESCEVGDYASPSVEIASLNGAASALDAAIASQTPSGGTPTGPAIAGAIAHARAWAAAPANADHTVVAVLATDGLPTGCTPTDIESIAGIAASGVAGVPSVPTYVIGVFNASNAGALANLNRIADAGGTNEAFVVDPTQNVEQQFLAAMNAIRRAQLACEYAVPAPPPGSTQDFGKVNVEFTEPGSSSPTTIAYVGSAGACDATTGGWYYDVDPATGATPTRIIMCSATCDRFGEGGAIDIRVGCETVVEAPQ